MKKRQTIVAGNWKMNKSYREGRDLAIEIRENLDAEKVLVILGVPYIHLNSIATIISDISNLKLAAQNCHHEASGAYTGEISAAMLSSVGADYVILGHSERREYFGETNTDIAKKVDTALANDLLPIYCFGEKLDVREADQHHTLIEQQVEEGLFHLSEADFKKVVLAYEPVWAIGTGKTASPEQAQEIHQRVREQIAKKYGQDVADQTPILYGGSVKPKNAAELFGQPDVDGGLVGGASLKAEDFINIINAG